MSKLIEFRLRTNRRGFLRWGVGRWGILTAIDHRVIEQLYLGFDPRSHMSGFFLYNLDFFLHFITENTDEKKCCTLPDTHMRHRRDGCRQREARGVGRVERTPLVWR